MTHRRFLFIIVQHEAVQDHLRWRMGVSVSPGAILDSVDEALCNRVPRTMIQYLHLRLAVKRQIVWRRATPGA